MNLKIKERWYLYGIVFFMVIVATGAVLYFGRTLIVVKKLYEKEAVTKKRITTDNLYDIDFPDAKNGWAVGYYGTIVHTSHGGETWEKQHSGTTIMLKGVDFVDANKGWIVGRKGLIIHTKDGGKTWERQISPTELNLTNVHFVNSQKGWISAEKSTILATENGGEEWFIQYQEEEKDIMEVVDIEEEVKNLNNIFFYDENNGWAVGEFGYILHTKDGGKTWERQDCGFKNTLFGIEFLEKDYGFVTGLDGLIIYTTDGGKTWQKSDTRLYKYHFFDIAFKPGYTKRGERLIAVGRGAIIYTWNRGEIWYRKDTKVKLAYTWLYSICFSTEADGWAVGENGGLIMHTKDAGMFWEEVLM
jgi:photosystem II stability/assembly factor-like uncharacterized protein